ncbi:MAG: hypothetical protein RL308_1567 [Bacteroidota bacterium]|jgi:hypothetical protein
MEIINANTLFMNNITFSFFKKKTSKTIKGYFSLLVLVLLSSQMSLGQTLDLKVGWEGSEVAWGGSNTTRSVTTADFRTGSKSMLGICSTGNGRRFTSVTIAQTIGSYNHMIVWTKASIAATADIGWGAAASTYNTAIAANTWTRMYYSTTAVATGTTTKTVSPTYTVTANTNIYIDDVVAYNSTSPSIDLASPASATTVTGTTTAGLSWTNGTDTGTGATGVRATLIFKRTAGTVGANDLSLNGQGVYSLTATAGPSAVGNWTLQKEDVLSSATSYATGTFTSGEEYAIIHRDLAYNYSAPAYVVIVASGSTPPTLTADATANSVDNNLDITSGGDTTWGAAITAVKIGATTLAAGDWDKTTTPGTLILKPSNGNSLLTTPGAKSVTIFATGYSDATVNQIITEGVPTVNSTATSSGLFALNTTRTITCTAKDQYNNLVSGYRFKYDATITNNSNTTAESYNLDSTAQTATVNDLSLVAITDGSGVATFTVALPATVDGNDGISIQVQLNNGSTNVGTAFSFTQLASQTISFGTLPTVTYGDATFNLAGTSDSGLAVTYVSSNTAVASVLGNVVTITGAGSTNIIASQSGNSSYNAAVDVVQGLTVNQKTLTIPDAVAASRVYNTLLSTNITGTLTGVVPADAGLVAFDGVLKGTFSDANAAIGIGVTSNCVLTGTRVGNYLLTQPTGLTADITTASQAITFATTSRNYKDFTTYTPNATSVTSGINPITFTSSNPAVAIIVSGQIQYVGIGLTTITASQAASTNYSAATANQTLNVMPTPLAAWNFWTASSTSQTTKQAYIFNSGLVTTSSANLITRGAGAAASGGTSAFRTTNFPVTTSTPSNLAVASNTVYFQTTIQASSNKQVSLSTIDANFYDAGGFSAAPGASSQFGYSLDGGTTIVPITALPVVSTSLTMTQLDLSGIAALQNVPSGTTIILRYYASGQVVNKGWGFGSPYVTSPAASAGVPGTDGLVIGGVVKDLTTTWNGTAWSNTSGPDSSIEAIIEGNYTTTNVAGEFSAKKLTVNSGTLTVSSGTTLTVQNEVINSGGSIVIENNANLIQVNNTTNTGSAVVNRNGSALSRLDYTLWSSPVDSQNVLNFSPLTVATRFYTYDTNAGTNGYYRAIDNPSTTSFTPGAGYLIRMPDNAAAAPTTQVFNGQFSGVLNNGNVPFTMTDGGAGKRFNLVGNPYPSPITMSSFVTDNANITGTLYFWRKTNGVGTAYCTWAGGTFVTNNNAQSANPNGVIQTGQGFFVEGNGNGTAVLFKNTQRVANTAGQFFRTTDVVENNRIWLNATNSAGAFSQMAVGYITGATQGIDAFDGKYINDSAVALTSNINNEEYTIQGRALPFVPSDVVSLNFKTITAGEYTIAIDHVDGLFTTGQDIYLVDSVSGTTTNLRNSAYTFTAVAGVNNSRFSLTFQSALNTNGVSFNDNNVKVYKNNGILNVNSGAISMKSVKIFDIQGRLIAEQKNVNATSTNFKDLRVNQQVLIVQVTSEDNIVVNKKVVN